MTETTGNGLARGGLRLVLLVLAVVVIVLALSAMIGWRVVAADARRDVSVTWAGPLECTGTTVEQVRPGDDRERIQAMRLREGMSCTLPVRVTNDSRFGVQVTRVRLPYMGPGGGAAVQVTRLDGKPWARKGSTDAVFRVRERLEPGESHDFDVVFEFRPPPQGCTSPGLLWIGDFPRVTVLALGRPGARTAPETIGFLGTRESDCST
jgi:hypothetical protein